MTNQIVYYEGSFICLISSHLFLLASLFNFFYCENYIEGGFILFLYFTSILYHSDGNKYIRELDIWITRITILICIILSLSKKNILPAIFTLIVIFFYYMNLSSQPLYHSLCIHLPGFFGFIALSFNR